MSLFIVQVETSIASEHCVSAPKYNNLPTPDRRVTTRVGRRFKAIEGAQRLAKRVGGYVSDLNSGRTLDDYRPTWHQQG